jgi:SAM-dependent methyltransferase
MAGLALALAHGVAAAPGFPLPERPVAPIITPAYSDERTRDERGEATRVLDRLGVRPGMRVADLGAGDGYYTVRLARRLGPGATIYAEDVKAEYLERLRARLARENITGVRLLPRQPGDPGLPRAAVDLAILAHVYHEIENPFEFMYRLRSALAPGARVAIVENDKPTQDHGTPPALLRCELAAVGYRELDLVLLAPADGYLAVFAPPEALPPVESIRACRP